MVYGYIPHRHAGKCSRMLAFRMCQEMDIIYQKIKGVLDAPGRKEGTTLLQPRTPVSLILVRLVGF